MAWRRTAVREATTGFRDELPGVARRSQHQFQHAERVVAPDLAVRDRRAGRPEVFAPRADHELADAAAWIGHALRRLGREALVVMLVTVEQHLGVRVVEVLQEGERL